MFDKTILIFLPMILFLGIITSYEDIKYGKIRNKWIIPAVIYAIVVNFLLFFIYFFFVKGQMPRIGYLVELFISVVISLVLGFVLWLVH